MKVPVGGGTPIALLTNPPWDNGACAAVDCPPVGELARPGDALTLNGDFVYFVMGDTHMSTGEYGTYVRRVPKAGGVSERIVYGRAQWIHALAVAGSSGFFTHDNFITGAQPNGLAIA